jgi:hypothetical protein
MRYAIKIDEALVRQVLPSVAPSNNSEHKPASQPTLRNNLVDLLSGLARIPQKYQSLTDQSDAAILAELLRGSAHYTIFTDCLRNEDLKENAIKQKIRNSSLVLNNTNPDEDLEIIYKAVARKRKISESLAKKLIFSIVQNQGNLLNKISSFPLFVGKNKIPLSPHSLKINYQVKSNQSIQLIIKFDIKHTTGNEKEKIGEATATVTLQEDEQLPVLRGH